MPPSWIMATSGQSRLHFAVGPDTNVAVGPDTRKGCHYISVSQTYLGLTTSGSSMRFVSFVSFVSLVSLVSLVSVVSLCKLVQHQGRYAGNAAYCRKGLLILHL